VGDLVGVGEVLASQRLAAEDLPPAFLQVEPTGALGMKAWRMRGWPFSQARVSLLLWLERLSMMITICRCELAFSNCCRNRW